MLLGEGSLAPGPAREPDGRRRARQGGDRAPPSSLSPAATAGRPAQHRAGRGCASPSAERDEAEPEVGADREGRVRLFCDDWEQASHSGDLAQAVEAGLIGREDVTQLGAVLAGEAPGRQSNGDITIFDSTGLAIQDLAIAQACIARAGELDLATLEL